MQNGKLTLMVYLRYTKCMWLYAEGCTSSHHTDCAAESSQYHEEAMHLNALLIDQ